jgi:hypothetical protein
MFKDGQTNVHDEEGSGQSSVVSDDLIQNEIQHFTISQLPCKFPQIFHIILYEIITAKIGSAITGFSQDRF